MLLTLTWCHCTPAETPTSLQPGCPIIAIRVEEDLHSVASGCYDWRQEVTVIRWISIRVAAAVVHQGCPVPIRDLDKVAWAGGDITSINSKVGELQPQYLPTLHFYELRLVEVVRIVARVVWRGDITCGFQDELKIIFHHSPSLPQPSAGQSGECIGCQSPAPVIESRTQVIVSVSQRPQQHWETNGDCSVPPLLSSSYWQSWIPAGAKQRWPRLGGK